MPHVLLVEDEPYVGELYQMGLVAAGHDTELVRSQDEALQRLDTLRYDVVITDWRLAHGGDGLAVAQRAAHFGMKTIVVSAYLFQMKDADRRHEYVMKPIRPTELTDVVKRVLAPPR